MKEVDKQGAQTMALVWLSGLAVLHKSACLVLFNTVCALLHCSCNQAYSKSFVDKAIAPEIVWFQARLPYISQKVNAPLSQGEKVWKVNVILTNCSLRWDYTGCQELWEHSGKRKLLEQQPSNMPSNVFFFSVLHTKGHALPIPAARSFIFLDQTHCLFRGHISDNQ